MNGDLIAATAFGRIEGAICCRVQGLNAGSGLADTSNAATDRHADSSGRDSDTKVGSHAPDAVGHLDGLASQRVRQEQRELLTANTGSSAVT